MNWIVLSLGAIFLWSLVNISDQYLVRKYSTEEKGPGGLVLFSSLIGILIAAIIAVFNRGILDVSMNDKFLLILTGGLSILWIIIYLYTLKTEEVSVVVPLFSMVPIWGYLLGYVFLGEILSQRQLIGSLVVISGVILVSIDFSQNNKFKLTSFIYMSIACFIIAIMGVIFKYVTIEGNFWVSSFWEYLGLGFWGILIFLLIPKYRKEFIYINRVGGLKVFSLNFLSEIITIIGNLFSNYAILLAPIVMVYIIGSFQPIVVLLLVIICSLFFPSVLKEKMDTKILIPKIIGILIISIGSIFLF